MTDALSASFNVPVSGSGTFHLESSYANIDGSLTFHDAVGNGITVNTSSPFLGTDLVLYDLKDFHAAITGFGYGVRIDLPQIQVTSETFANNELTLFGQDGVLGKLNIIGDFQTNQFSVANNAQGSVISFNPHVPAAGPASMIASQTDTVSAMLPNS